MRAWLIIVLFCCSSCALAQEEGSVATYPYLGSLMQPSGLWELHPGLNASLSAAAIIGLGSNSATGFANSMAVMYAGKMSPRLSFVMGGYSSFLDWGSRQMKDSGLSAMLSYRIDERWEAAVFAQKSLMQPRLPAQQLWWLGADAGDKIGAMVKYKINPNLSFQVSVWDQRNAWGSRW